MPKIGKKERHEHISRRPAHHGHEQPENIGQKICAALKCPRCGTKFEHYRVVCSHCFACLYCGLVGGSAYDCHLCGNSLPEEDRVYPNKTHRIV